MCRSTRREFANNPKPESDAQLHAKQVESSQESGDIVVQPQMLRFFSPGMLTEMGLGLS